MTITDVSALVPTPSATAWRATIATPPDVRLEAGEGRLCPIDQTPLERSAELPGLICPRCVCWWDRHGRNGMWLTDPPAVIDGEVVTGTPDLAAVQAHLASTRRGRLDRAVAGVVGMGCVIGLGYGAIYRFAAPVGLVLLAFGLVAATVAVVLALIVLVHWLDMRRPSGVAPTARQLGVRDAG